MRENTSQKGHKARSATLVCAPVANSLLFIAETLPAVQ
jgi:hypothetical protein